MFSEFGTSPRSVFGAMNVSQYFYSRPSFTIFTFAFPHNSVSLNSFLNFSIIVRSARIKICFLGIVMKHARAKSVHMSLAEFSERFVIVFLVLCSGGIVLQLWHVLGSIGMEP